MAKVEDNPTRIKWRIPDAVELAAWLRVHRPKAGLSQRELARLTGYTRTSVWRVENCATDRTDRKIPSITMACRLWKVVAAMESGNLNFVKRLVAQIHREKSAPRD